MLGKIKIIPGKFAAPEKKLRVSHPGKFASPKKSLELPWKARGIVSYLELIGTLFVLSCVYLVSNYVNFITLLITF